MTLALCKFIRRAAFSSYSNNLFVTREVVKRGTICVCYLRANANLFVELEDDKFSSALGSFFLGLTTISSPVVCSLIVVEFLKRLCRVSVETSRALLMVQGQPSRHRQVECFWVSESTSHFLLVSRIALP